MIQIPHRVVCLVFKITRMVLKLGFCRKTAKNREVNLDFVFTFVPEHEKPKILGRKPMEVFICAIKRTSKKSVFLLVAVEAA
jgi:hypothetical protein